MYIFSRWPSGIIDIVMDFLPMEDLLAKSKQELARHTWEEVQEAFNHIFYPKSKYTIGDALTNPMKREDVFFRERAWKRLQLVVKSGSLDEIQSIYRLIMRSKSPIPCPKSMPFPWIPIGRLNACNNLMFVFTKKALSNLSIQADKLKTLCGHLIKYEKESHFEKITPASDRINLEIEEPLLIRGKIHEKILKKTGIFQDLMFQLFNFIKNLTEEEFAALKNEISEENNPHIAEMLDLIDATKLALDIKHQLESEDFQEEEDQGLLVQIFDVKSPLLIEFMVLEINTFNSHEPMQQAFNDRWKFLSACFDHPACPPECRGRILEHIVSDSERIESENVDEFFSSRLEEQNVSNSDSEGSEESKEDEELSSSRLEEQNVSISGSLTGEKKLLHIAASLNLSKTMKEILRRNSEEINYQNNDGDTALHVAADAFAYDVMDQLIDHGAKLNIQNKKGSTPLIEFLYDDDPDREALVDSKKIPPLVTELLSKGAKPNIASSDGKTSLHFAVCWKFGDEVIPSLLEWGANPNLLDADGASPLIYALKTMGDTKDEKSTMALLESEKIDVNKGKDLEDNTPLHLAVSYSTGEELDDFDGVINELLALGANIHAKNNSEETPLDEAISDKLKNKLIEGYNEAEGIAKKQKATRKRKKKK